ncbi:putative mitochondrial protein [Cucumis melo var. makuwa]|uniref:Mitochondrial protein n=1 Tax=Cucumis melo var. makuwa TaxID=1194695 RepID=A0A5A7U0X5_CUCMM|nr:putative mitochondrial protein [Cucumis melo var. makuwa]
MSEYVIRSIRWFESILGPQIASVRGAFDLERYLQCGRLAQTLKGTDKKRIFAIGNYIKQCVLYPIYRWAMDLQILMLIGSSMAQYGGVMIWVSDNGLGVIVLNFLILPLEPPIPREKEGSLDQNPATFRGLWCQVVNLKDRRILIMLPQLLLLQPIDLNKYPHFGIQESTAQAGSEDGKGRSIYTSRVAA